MTAKTKNSQPNNTETFRTPHEQKAVAKAASKGKSKAGKKAKQPKSDKSKEVKSSKRDAFNGIIGTRCSKINVAVIEAGKKGATVQEVAEKTGEATALVSAQLGWMFKPKGYLTREKEGKSFRYYVKAS